MYVKSKAAGERVLKSLEKFLWKHLRLSVNKEKSGVIRPLEHKFLGYSFYSFGKTRLRIAPTSLKRVKDNIRRRKRR